jgi:dTDP-4-amino-4,6-dideoxygalactose transaminase
VAVSRGSVRHSLGEDLGAFATTIFRPARLAARATAVERAELAFAVRRRFDSSFVVGFPYARTGVHAVLEAMRLPEGSEVLLTPITIGPMLEVILALGLKPVFVDIELKTFGPDPIDLARKLEHRPAAFLLTYLFGYVPDVKAIMSACAASGTRVIEDISHNIGATFAGRPLGTYGVAGVHSASLLKYVDGYNGAFVVTDDTAIADSLAAAASRLTPPSPRRIRGCIKRTLFWNLALNRYVFNLGTYPALACLKAVSPATFEKLLGPAIALHLETAKLPDYYFEDIAGYQIHTIIRQLDRLGAVLTSRRDCALLARQAWLDVTGGQSVGCSATEETRLAAPTFWQFVVAVEDVARSRNVLFRRGVETGTTNLMDLAQASGISLPNTRALKERHIFVPLHRHLRQRDYANMFSALREAGQI